MHVPSHFTIALLIPIVLSTLIGCDSNTPNGPTQVESTKTNVQPNTPDLSLPETDDHASKVLRHAVFFSFKETSSEADVQTVIDAFRGLPAKIDAITDFQSGVNNSPEGKDDGFTHCFLLTFDDEAGIEEYIPHPSHKGDFADVLRPHMKDVFVFDYWGLPYEPMDSELKHAVFFKFKADAAAEDVKKVEDAFAALPSKIDAIKHFEWGLTSSKLEADKDDEFTHGFMVTFDSEAGREVYLPHPDHAAFVETLLPVLDKVRVLDFWGERVEQPSGN